MNIVFFANGDFAVPTFLKIASSKHNLLCLVSNKNSAVTRKKLYRSSKIKSIAIKKNVKLIEQDNLKSTSFVDKLSSLNADLFVVISYKIIPKSILSLPKKGAINLHASYLPKYRGSSPIQRALMNGDISIGLTTFFLNEKVDKGDIIKQKKYTFSDRDTYSHIHDSLANNGPEILINSIGDISKNSFKPIKQNYLKASYAKKIYKDELKIDFNNDSKIIHNKIRALDKPGCYCYYSKLRIKLIDTYYIIDHISQNSDISNNDYSKHELDSFDIGNFIFSHNLLYIKCKVGWLTAEKIQIQGKNTVSASDFKNRNHKEMTFK